MIHDAPALVFKQLTESLQEQLTLAHPDVSSVAADLLAVPPQTILSADDAGKFLHLLTFLSRSPLPGARAWEWAKTVAKTHLQNAGVLSLLASLGDQLRHQNSGAAVTVAELEILFRRAMEVGPDQAGAFARAGLFYLNQQNDAEAERCLAQAFRLDSANAFVAIQLSDLFARSDRPADALSVLQQCMDKGTVEPEMLWKAGLAATALSRAEPALKYLTQLQAIQPDRRWLQYYRAIALLGLNQFAEADDAIERESDLIKMPTALHVHAVRASVAAGLDNLVLLRKHIQAALAPPLALVNYLSREGIIGCFSRLWAAAGKLPVDDLARQQLQTRLLTCGLTPAEFWDQQRLGHAKAKGLRHFWCDLRQPLDSQWAYQGALPGQENWKAYTIRYGVLASDETQAAAYALQWQFRSASLPAQLVSTTAEAGTYTDTPGISQRGYPSELT